VLADHSVTMDDPACDANNINFYNPNSTAASWVLTYFSQHQQQFNIDRHHFLDIDTLLDIDNPRACGL
jgi:hypothetical protein